MFFSRYYCIHNNVFVKVYIDYSFGMEDLLYLFGMF